MPVNRYNDKPCTGAEAYHEHTWDFSVHKNTLEIFHNPEQDTFFSTTSEAINLIFAPLSSIHFH